MREITTEYKKKLEKGISEYMSMPISERTATAVCGMLSCLEKVNRLLEDEHGPLTTAEILKWMSSLQNEDGTEGAHWSVSDTNTLPHEGKDECWNAAMNMMYSDYFPVAVKYGLNSAEFFADLAAAFLSDKDGHEHKLANYYRHVIKG